MLRNRICMVGVTSSMLFPCLALSSALFMMSTFASTEPYSFSVKVVGHGAPMILIPGLTCGGDVWNSTVDHYKSRYECHVLTLPGFAGQPPIAAPIMPRVRDEIIAYIKEKHLQRPVIVGHSLGGTLALWIASLSPESVGRVVAVDGVPWIPALDSDHADMKTATAQAISIRSMIDKGGKKTFAAVTKQSLASMITSPKDLEEVFKTSSLSDPASVGEAMFELYTTDLRPEMAKVKAPVLLLAEGAFYTTPAEQKKALALYEAEIHSVPNHTVKMSLKSRHFIMLDDPAFMFKAMDAFLK